METWSPTGVGFVFGAQAQKPPGEGWALTGYSQRRIPMNPNRMGSGFRTVQVPIYTRQTQAAPAPASAPAPAQAPAQAPASAQDPTPLNVNQTQSTNPYQSQIDDLLKVIAGMAQPAPAPVVNIEPPKPTFAGSTAVDGNATGFTRAKSAAKRAGLTNKGTARLRINRTGQTTASSGLNIGV